MRINTSKLSKIVTLRIVSMLLIMVFVLVIMGYFFMKMNLASAFAYDWVSTEPVAVKDSDRSTIISEPQNNQQSCQNQEVYIGNAVNKESVCVYYTKSFRFAAYNHCILTWYGSCNYEQRFIIGFEDDSRMYRVNGLSGLSYNWIASRETDTLIFNSYGLSVIKNLPAYLTKSVAADLSPQYDFNEVGRHDVSTDDHDNYLAITPANMSSNGKWAAVKIQHTGLARLNLEDYTFKLYTKDVPPSGYGMDPAYQFSITNDGRFIASGGNNVSTKIYDVDQACGAESVIVKYDWRSETIASCPSRNLDYQISEVGGGASVQSTNYLRFSEDGGQINIFAAPYANTQVSPYWVRLTAQGYVTSSPREYLALGDSYSSGEGDTVANPATNKKYYQNYTDNELSQSLGVPREKCHVSTRSYPYILAQGMNLALESPKEWNTVACSGGTSWDVSRHAWNAYEGQNNRLLGFEVDTLKLQALNEMIPGRQKQIKFVEKYQPKVITLTMGGNDIGFADKLKSCITPLSTCYEATDTGKKALGNQIKEQYDNLRSLYEELYQASGSKAKIYVLGYPQFISGDSSATCPLNAGWFNNEEREMISSSVTYMNNTIKKAAEIVGVEYIDMENSLQGHRLCDSGEPYVTGIAAWGDSEMQESFHPNRKGNHAMAMSLWDKVNNESLLDYDICPASDANICPDITATKDSIVIPEYFQLGGSINSRYGGLVSQKVIKGSPLNIEIGPYKLTPNSNVQVTLHSDPINLGEYTTNQEGVLDIDVSIPVTVPAGYHTLIVEGQTYSGEPIQYEQVILVRGYVPTDIDDDSINDNVDPCLFVPAVNVDIDMDGVDDICDAEISPSPQLYRTRPGESIRTYNGSPERVDYIYVERNTRASSITGVTNDYDPDGDGWAIVGASQGLPFSTSSVPDTGPATNFIVSGEGSGSKPTVYIRAGGYGCTSFVPVSLSRVEEGQERNLKRIAYNTDKCRQEAPSDDVDGDGMPDNTQPLYTARSGDASKGEDPNRLYLYRNFYSSEAQLGISDYTPTGTPAGNPDQPIQKWNLLASSQGEYVPAFNKLVMLRDANDKPLPVILTKKQNGQCIAYQPESTAIIKMTTQNTRKLIKLGQVPQGFSCD